MNEPMRIQRRRVKGWKMPENTVSVTRPGKWGNKYRAVKFMDVWAVEAGGVRFRPSLTREQAVKDSLNLYQIGLFDNKWGTPDESLNELTGKNLACYCKLCDKHKDGRPLGVTCQDCEPCHVDILGELIYANKTKSDE